ncbi:MAG: putative TonB-like protein [Proteobacteria bacterium]|nr:putative TonB-like protein [Pseudomonadota bacterium]
MDTAYSKPRHRFRATAPHNGRTHHDFHLQEYFTTTSMTAAVVNNDPGIRRWHLPLVGMAISALLHAVLWQTWLMRRQEPEPTPTPPQVIEVSLLAAQPPSVQQPPQPEVKPPPPKPEKPPEKPAPKKPDKPKPAPKKPPAPPPPKQEVPAAPEIPAPAAEAPTAAAPAKSAAPTPPPFVEASYKAPSLNNPPTRYPPVALERRWEGKVALRVQVLPAGTAGEIRIEQSSGHEILDDAAVEQVRSWRFLPARRGDQAVASWVIVPIEYKLKH